MNFVVVVQMSIFPSSVSQCEEADDIKCKTAVMNAYFFGLELFSYKLQILTIGL